MPVVRTNGRAGDRSVYGHVITKVYRMGSLPHFLTHGAPLRAVRARELRYYASHSFTNEVQIKLNEGLKFQAEFFNFGSRLS